MKKCLHLLLILLIITGGCTTTKVKLRKANLSDTNITFKNYIFNDFESAFRTLNPKEAYNLAKTEAQKTAAEALDYVTQSRYEDASETFINAMKTKDTLEKLWNMFSSNYYKLINYNWWKLEEYENMFGITDNSFVFYKNKPEFQIKFLKDSVIIPIELQSGLPMVRIKINGKFYYFLIDTGCNATIIGKNIAITNNIVCDNVEIASAAIDGNFICFSGFLPELDLGQIKISNFPIAVIDRNNTIKAKFLFITYFQCDGIIGWDLLCKLDVTIDYKNKQLVLRKPVKKDVTQRNLFWYYDPIVRFYCNGYPILAFLDTGASLTFFYQVPNLSKIFEINTNSLKKGNIKHYGFANEKASLKEQYYKYPNFQCYTIANNEMSYLTASKILLVNKWNMPYIPINVDALLGSNWFKNKSIRIDMLNGLFEIE